jgi:hypothetical protein
MQNQLVVSAGIGLFSRVNTQVKKAANKRMVSEDTAFFTGGVF